MYIVHMPSWDCIQKVASGKNLEYANERGAVYWLSVKISKMEIKPIDALQDWVSELGHEENAL